MVLARSGSGGRSGVRFRAEFPRARQRVLQASGDACVRYLPLAIARGHRTGFDLDWSRLPLANLSFIEARGYHPRWERLSQSLTSELVLEFVFPYARGGSWEERACWVFSSLRPAQVDLRWRYLLGQGASGVLGDVLCVLVTERVSYAFGLSKLRGWEYDSASGVVVVYSACGRSVCVPASPSEASLLESWRSGDRVRLVDWTVCGRNRIGEEERGCHEIHPVSETGSFGRSPVVGAVDMSPVSDAGACDGEPEPVACRVSGGEQ